MRLQYLSDFELPANVSATTDLAEAMAGVQLIIHALPCQKTPEWFAEHRDAIPSDVLICSTVKGLFLPTKQLIGHAILEALGREQPIAFLSGPSFSIEIMKDYPTSVVVASRELFHATLVQRVLSNMFLRVHVHAQSNLPVACDTSAFFDSLLVVTDTRLRMWWACSWAGR